MRRSLIIHVLSAVVLFVVALCSSGDAVWSGVTRDQPAGPTDHGLRVPSSGTPLHLAKKRPAPTENDIPESSQPATQADAPSQDRGGLVDPRDGGLDVALGEWAVILEADTIRPGTVTFMVRNSGARAHGFRIRSEGGRGRDRFEARTELIQPGGSSKLTVDLKSGSYRVDCFVEEPGVGDHAALGMRGLLTVRPDAPFLSPKAPVADTAVSIEGFVFSPQTLKIQAGSTVVWTNRDPAPHTVTADDGTFDSGMLQSGATFRRTFEKAGTFRYTCTIHPSMKGVVEVAAP